MIPTHRHPHLIVALTAAALATACATAPDTRAERADLETEAHDALHAMIDKDPSLRAAVEDAAGYAVFPTVGEGAVLAGGTFGQGVVFEDGETVGYAAIREGSFGAQVGGQAYRQLIVFRDAGPFRDLQDGEFQVKADASATMVRQGAAASAPAQDDVAIYVDQERGAMVEAAVGGQLIDFEPAG